MKAIKILIFTIIAVLVIGAGTVALIYFYTDTFKTNQEIFYKYFSEKDAVELFDSTAISEFSTKLATNSNEQNIKITVNGNMGEESIADGQTVLLNNKVDNPNKKMESKIIFGNNEDDNLLEVGLARNNDIYGLIVKDVINQYVTVENNNLQDFTSNLGLGNVDIADKIEVGSYLDKLKEVQNSSNTFLKDLYNTLKNETNKQSYSKLGKTTIEIGSNKIETNAYELNLKADQFKPILSKTKQFDNESTLNTIIAQILGTDDINNLNLGISIKIYLQNKKLVKIDISIQDDTKSQSIEISKTSNSLLMQINDDGGMQISADITRNGEINSDKISCIANLQAVSEQDNMQLSLDLEADFVFNSNFEVIDLDEENSANLNNIEGEKVLNLLQIIIQKTQSDTGFNDTILVSLINLGSQFKTSIPIDEEVSDMELQAIKIFNSSFVAYEGEQAGIPVKTLIEKIKTNNSSQEKQVKITYNGGTDEIEIISSNKYKVSFKYDDEGYINTVNIDE